MNWIKKLFHDHIYIVTSRKLVGHGRHTTSRGGYVDSNKTNIYLEKSYCIECKQRFVRRYDIMQMLDTEQPYDIHS